MQVEPARIVRYGGIVVNNAAIIVEDVVVVCVAAKVLGNVGVGEFVVLSYRRIGAFMNEGSVLVGYAHIPKRNSCIPLCHKKLKVATGDIGNAKAWCRVVLQR